MVGFCAHDYAAAKNDKIKVTNQIPPATVPAGNPGRLRKTEQPPQTRHAQPIRTNQDDAGSRSLKRPKFRTKPKEPKNGPPYLCQRTREATLPRRAASAK